MQSPFHVFVSFVFKYHSLAGTNQMSVYSSVVETKFCDLMMCHHLVQQY